MGLVLSEFVLSDVDMTGAVYYLGYVSSQGGWYIKAIDTSVADVYGFEFAYTAGDTGYAAAWAGRAALVYQAYSAAF